MSVNRGQENFTNGTQPESPMLCESPGTPDWNREITIVPNPNDIQSYIQMISQLESKLQMAQTEIYNLQQQVLQQQQDQKDEKKPKQAQSRYWTDEEHQRFLEALDRFGHKDVKSIANYVGSRNPTQVRTHAQKYFLRLERERQKEEEKVSHPDDSPDYESAQVDRFLMATKATTFEPDVHRRSVLIHERFMPDTSVEEIKAWLCVHKKTVEKIQVSEVQHAAKSVGAKRLRSSSNPVTFSPRHVSMSTSNDDYFMKKNFVSASTATTPLAQSQPGSYFAKSTQSSSPVMNMGSFPAHPQFYDNHRQRPQSMPLGFNQGMVFDHHINFLDNSLIDPILNQEPMHGFSDSPFNLTTIHSPMQSHSMMGHHSNPSIKPYIPGAPPPSSPAPPPPHML